VSPTQLGWVFVLLFVTLLPGFGEEFGWRGYLLPHLAERHSPRQAVFLHVVIWWAWHLPVLVGGAVVVGMASPHVAHLPVGLSVVVTVLLVAAVSVIPSVLNGVIFAYIWSRMRSLAVTTVYHATYDGMRDSLAATIGLGPITGEWATLLLVMVGLALLWKGNWSNLKARATAQVLESSEMETPVGSQR
jgi:membrane protease YdiL (CAAX protease family)